MSKNNLLETFKRSKVEIAQAVTTAFPFLPILRDYAVISDERFQQAEESQNSRPLSEVVYKILTELEKEFNPETLTALFHQSNLKKYVPLVKIQKRFKDVLLGEPPSKVNGGALAQMFSLDEEASNVSTSQSSNKDAENNNVPSKVGRKRKPRAPRKQVSWVRKRGPRKVLGPKVNYHLPELPVTCREATGTLHKNKFKKSSSEKCIQIEDGTWLTVSEFEIKGGRRLSKNWKKSILCGGYTLHYLIQKKILPKPPRKYVRRKKNASEPGPKRRYIRKKENASEPGPKRRYIRKKENASEPGPKRRYIRKKENASEPGPKRRYIRRKENASEPGPKRRYIRRKENASEPGSKRTYIRRTEVAGKPHSSLSQLSVRSPVTVSLANRPKYLARLRVTDCISVKCQKSTGILYKKRFASVYRGKCILTETQWCTPAEFLCPDSEMDLVSWTHNIFTGSLSLQTLIENEILKLHADSCACTICKGDYPFPENSDDCFVCAEEGYLFCCDSCPKSFHENCHIPTIPENCAEFICTFCIIKKNKAMRAQQSIRYQEESQVIKHPMNIEHQMKCEFLLLRMYCRMESVPFTKDPCQQIKNYSKQIRNPMWLDQVKERLSNETYNIVEGFVLDVRQIFYNCKKFNKNNYFGLLGAKLETEFEKDFKAVFDIKEEDKEEMNNPGSTPSSSTQSSIETQQRTPRNDEVWRTPMTTPRTQAMKSILWEQVRSHTAEQSLELPAACSSSLFPQADILEEPDIL
ncbi:nuclear body protein SP140-like protein isoform X3 [Monodelphis domestica]|uniref:nuclear body protein SP140-like protein isoform X3 n=1 Tax=Monodelphis domestica TaxID=13616 RepID=UPI0024E19AB5|nr:nuclear body protein SP140-like protein isoform X3 [Monodelphis domestica]